MLVPVAHASPFSPWLKLASPKQNKTTPCIYFHHLFRNRVSLLQKISSQNLSVLPVSSQVSSVMVPAVSLDSLGLWQKLGGKDQESESGRERAPKQTHSRSRSRVQSWLSGGIACERACVCGVRHGKALPWKERLSATKELPLDLLLWADYIWLQSYPPQLNLTNLWKVTLKELLPLCSMPVNQWAAEGRYIFLQVALKWIAIGDGLTKWF